jgi:hypothetical protein
VDEHRRDRAGCNHEPPSTNATQRCVAL